MFDEFDRKNAETVHRKIESARQIIDESTVVAHNTLLTSMLPSNADKVKYEPLASVDSTFAKFQRKKSVKSFNKAS